MDSPVANKPSLPRLLHLVSPSLPTGAFAYSQGLEWAMEAGWIGDGLGLKGWLADLLGHSMVYVDIPILKRMVSACEANQETALGLWCSRLLACRETRELRLEEMDRGVAMLRLLQGLGVPFSHEWKKTAGRCQLAGFALAAVQWEIPLEDAAIGYAWSWLENQVLAGMKTIPLGQTEGHGILLRLGESVRKTVAQGLLTPDENIGAANPALAIASCLHETQYTRLYRS